MATNTMRSHSVPPTHLGSTPSYPVVFGVSRTAVRFLRKHGADETAIRVACERVEQREGGRLMTLDALLAQQYGLPVPRLAALGPQAREELRALGVQVWMAVNLMIAASQQRVIITDSAMGQALKFLEDQRADRHARRVAWNRVRQLESGQQPESAVAIAGAYGGRVPQLPRLFSLQKTILRSKDAEVQQAVKCLIEISQAITGGASVSENGRGRQLALSTAAARTSAPRARSIA